MIGKLTSKTVVVHLLILIVITIMVYHLIFIQDFMYLWDDQWQVINPMTEKGFSLDNLKNIFNGPNNGQYSPVNQLYYTLLFSIGGYNAMLFHAGSLLFHLLNSITVYFLICFLLEKSSLPCFKTNIFFTAFITSLLFAIHPINTESVCWISASKIVSGTLFYLLAILFYMKYKVESSKVFFAISIICACLSAGCKEQVVTLWVCLLLIDWTVLKRNMLLPKIYFEKIPYLLLAIFVLAITLYATEGSDIKTVGYTFTDRFIFFAYSLFDYIWLSVFPFKLSYLYPFPYQIGEAIPMRLWIYPFIVIFIGYVVFLFRKRPFVIFFSLFFLLQLLPVLHIIPLPRFAIVADRYLYLSYISIAFLFAVIIQTPYLSKYRKWISGLFVIYIVYLSAYTLVYSRTWQNSNFLKQNIRELLQERKSLVK